MTWRHGTLHGYNHYQCRCPDCRQAVRDHNRTYQARIHTQLATNPDHPAHATLHGYNCGCRCQSCVATKSAYDRRRRANRTLCLNDVTHPPAETENR